MSVFVCVICGYIGECLFIQVVALSGGNDTNYWVERYTKMTRQIFFPWQLLVTFPRVEITSNISFFCEKNQV